jgi:hypothetical protein
MRKERKEKEEGKNRKALIKGRSWFSVLFFPPLFLLAWRPGCYHKWSAKLKS